jgi:hypothetical protein
MSRIRNTDGKERPLLGKYFNFDEFSVHTTAYIKKRKGQRVSEMFT